MSLCHYVRKWLQRGGGDGCGSLRSFISFIEDPVLAEGSVCLAILVFSAEYQSIGAGSGDGKLNNIVISGVNLNRCTIRDNLGVIVTILIVAIDFFPGEGAGVEAVAELDYVHAHVDSCREMTAAVGLVYPGAFKNIADGGVLPDSGTAGKGKAHEAFVVAENSSEIPQVSGRLARELYEPVLRIIISVITLIPSVLFHKRKTGELAVP